MKAVVVHGPNDLRYEDVDALAADPADGSVRLRITHGGICGSDLHYAHEGRVGAFVITEPLVLGHEVAGVIEHDPSGALAAGTPVTVHPATIDTGSPDYQADRPCITPGTRYLGSAAVTPHVQGGFADLIDVRADQVRALPDGLEPARGVLAEPLGVALHAVTRAGDDLSNARVLVSGAGPIGLLTVRAALRSGAAEVYAADLQSRPLELATRLGANGVFQVGSDEVPERGFDVVIEASGVPAALSAATSAVRSGGVIVEVGMLPGGPQPYTLNELVTREIDLRGAFRFNDEIDDAVTMLADDSLLAEVITHTFPARDAERAFETASDASVSSKVVLEF